MDLLKTPSVQSLMDSDLESVESLQYLDIEELDEVEYALPTSEAPTLAEVLSAQEELEEEKIYSNPASTRQVDEPTTCSALQVDFLQAVSQQLVSAQDRSSAGASTALCVGTNGRLTVGTAHGHLLSFQDQTLRWICDSNADRGAVSCLAYNKDSSRILVGFGRGLICQYEGVRGIILRRITLGGDMWGTLQVTWAGSCGVALDTGGSVWLIKFSRPLGVRQARASCLFSGARGEVVTMAARDACILALATLSRVIIVAGCRAASAKFGGPSDTLPVLAWCETDERILVCGRANILQWHAVTVTGSNIALIPIKRMEMKHSPLWLGWLGGCLAIFDADEKIRLWGEDYDKPLDLSHIEPVYASAFFKGHWTDGKVSRAMCTAGNSALGGACVSEGSLCLLGRKGVVRIRPRDLLARARAFFNSERYTQALRLLCSTQGQEATNMAIAFVNALSERPRVLSDKQVADLTVKMCLKFHLSEELWTGLWEQCTDIQSFVEAIGDAAVRGDLADMSPSPDCSQALIEKLAQFEPGLVERVVASLPLTSLDPHRAMVFTRSKGLWRGVGAIAAALGGCSGAMRELIPYVDAACGARDDKCSCAGGALLLAAADALAGRGVGGRSLPEHARPSARRDALQALLHEEDANPGVDNRSPLQVLVEHETRSAVRLLEQSAREPPFAGPLAKQNRLRVARGLLRIAPGLQGARRFAALCERNKNGFPGITYTSNMSYFGRTKGFLKIVLGLQDQDDQVEIIEFIIGQILSGAIPPDREVISNIHDLASKTYGEKADRAWLLLLNSPHTPKSEIENHIQSATDRPRVLWRLNAIIDNHEEAIQQFFKIDKPSNEDIDELFQSLQAKIENDGTKALLQKHLKALMELNPRVTAKIAIDNFPDSIPPLLKSSKSVKSLEFAGSLLESGRLSGEAANEYLKNLCLLRPDEVTLFLSKNEGLIRPEEALRIVKEFGPKDAEPVCLEATGDSVGALDVLLKLASSSDGETRTRLISEAGSLCARVAPTVPPSVSADMWTRLLQHAGSSPTLLLEAVAYLPVETLLERTDSPQVALAVLKSAARRKHKWECFARIVARESHEALAKALHKASKALAVRGCCISCGKPLSIKPAIRTAHCSRASHMDCEPEKSCGVCGMRIPETLFAFPSSSRPNRENTPNSPPESSMSTMNQLRPDLEGFV